MATSRSDLDNRLLAAHEDDDREKLVLLYAEAADQSEAAGDSDAACFYLTHAYVFALETGVPEADGLQYRLWQYGREVKPLTDQFDGQNPTQISREKEIS